MRLEILKSALYNSWSADTCYPSYRKVWSPEKPNEHQCAVTALVVCHLLGGEILERKHKSGRAFYNRLPDGTTIDLSDQNCHEADGPERPRDPQELLRGHTKVRFKKLLDNLQQTLPPGIDLSSPV